MTDTTILPGDCMDADSLCIGCVNRGYSCPIDPDGKVTLCVEYSPDNETKAFLESLKTKE